MTELATVEQAVEPAEAGSKDVAFTAPSHHVAPQRWFLRWPLAVVKFFVGVLLCQSALGAMLVVGWTQRLLQRRVLRSWQKRTKNQTTRRRKLPPQRVLPNWLVAEPGAKPKRRLGRWFGSLAANARQGLTGAFNIAVWTLPATSLWLYSWVLGWNISFFKLYEQSQLGAVLGFSGVLLFVATMLYVPMAHVRQAVTGDWRSFYHVRFNWALARRVRGRLLLIAGAFAAASAVAMIFHIAPYFAGSAPEFANYSDTELVDWLNGYYFATGVVLLPLYAGVWLFASRAYAAAAVQHFQHDPDHGAWRPMERRALSAIAGAPHAYQGALATVRWSLGRLTAWGLTAASCLVWFVVAGEVFFAQFFNYMPGVHWLNHPLVLLPWIRYIPPGLEP